MTDLLWIGLAVVVVVVVARRRIARAEAGSLSDALVRQIETTGRIEADDVDPLDVARARAEEDEFWSQTWDEPEEI